MFIEIVNNQIGEKGCRYISKAAWGKLENILLSSGSLTKIGISSAIGDAGTSARGTGRE